MRSKYQVNFKIDHYEIKQYHADWKTSGTADCKISVTKSTIRVLLPPVVSAGKNRLSGGSGIQS